MNTAAPAEVRILLEPSSITPAEQDAAHASPYYVKLQHEGVARFGTAIVTDDHRVVVEIENGEMYAMQLTSDAATRLRTALESWTKGDDDGAVELDPPNTYRGVGIVAEDGPAPGSVLAEVHGQRAAAHLFEDRQTVQDLRARVGGFTPPSGPASPGPAMFDDFPPTHVHGLEVPPFADDVEGLTEYGLSLLPADLDRSPGGLPAKLLRSAAAMVVGSHRAALQLAERWREIPADPDPEIQRRADALRASLGGSFVAGVAEVDNLRRAELVPLDLQIEAALRLVAEARAGEGDGACRECGHPVAQRRLASIQHALEQMRTLPGEVDPGGPGLGVRPLLRLDDRQVARMVGAMRAVHLLPTHGEVFADEVATHVEKLCAEHEMYAVQRATTRGTAVDTRFIDLFYLAGDRVALRFEGILSPLAVLVDDARRLALAINTNGESLMRGDDNGEALPRMMLVGPEPADNIRIKVRLDWQDPGADMRRLFAATEGARGALESRRRLTEQTCPKCQGVPQPAEKSCTACGGEGTVREAEAQIELVLPFEAHEMLVTAEGGALLERLRAEFPFVVAVRERGLPSHSDASAELQTIAERVGPAIGEGQIALQERRPGDVARAVRTLAERYAAVRPERAEAEVTRLRARVALLETAVSAAHSELSSASGAASEYRIDGVVSACDAAAALLEQGLEGQADGDVVLVHRLDRATFEAVADGRTPMHLDMQKMCAKHRDAERSAAEVAS